MTYGGGGYWINPGPGNKNYWFVGWVLQRQVTDSLALGGEIFHQTSFATGGPGSPGFPLGSKDTTGFNLGGTYDFDQNHHLLFSAGRALQNASTTNAFSYYLALQWISPERRERALCCGDRDRCWPPIRSLSHRVRRRQFCG